MSPYSTITAETLLQEWEALAHPAATLAYQTARTAMHAALAALLPCTDPGADMNLDPEDLRDLLHRVRTFRAGTATAHGPHRAEEAMVQALASAVWLGPHPNEPPLRGLLFLGSAPDAEVEMDELASAIAHLELLVQSPLEVLFGHRLLPSLPPGTLSITLLLVYGPLLSGGPLSPLPLPAPSDYSDPGVPLEVAARLVTQKQFATTALLQRRLKLGYHRSLRMLDELEQAGIIGPPNPDGRPERPILVPDEQALLLLQRR